MHHGQPEISVFHVVKQCRLITKRGKDMVAAKGSRVDWIDAAKGISIILVTLYHVVDLSSFIGLPVELTAKFNSYLQPIRMPLFFAAAGVFAGSSLTLSWSALFAKRIWSFIWLFVIWTLVRWLFVGFVAANPKAADEGTAIAEIGWAMLMPVTGLWFLWSLAIFFIVAKALNDFDRRIGFLVALVVSLFALAFLRNAHGPYVQNLAHRNSLMYFFFFYAAATYPQIVTALGRVRIAPAATLGAVGWVAFYVLAMRMPWPLVKALLLLCSSVTGVGALFLVARTLNQHGGLGGLLRYLGANTLPIYVAQVPVIITMLLLVRPYSEQMGREANMLMVVITAFVVCITLGLRNIAIRVGFGWLYSAPKLNHVLPWTRKSTGF